MVHVKPKRPLVPVPFLQSVIDEIVSASSEKALTPVLERFDSPHHFERPEERNLLNWYKVLNRFDDLLERYVNSRNVFSKSSGGEGSSRPPQDRSASGASFPLSTPSPENAGAAAVDATPAKPDPSNEKPNRGFTPSPSLVRLILRLTQRLLRNASHDTRTVYNSVEHIGALLADDNSAIVLLSLEVLNMLMQRSHKLRSNRTHITFELSERLLEMAAGWGGRENRLGMLECCSSKNSDSLPSDGRRLYFEYNKSSNPVGQSSEAPSIRVERQPENPAKKSTSNLQSRLVMGPIPLPLSPSKNTAAPSEEPVVVSSGSSSAIVIDDVTRFQGSERWLLDFAGRNDVPKAKWFSLLSAFRRAREFGKGRDARVEQTILRLYAITTLFQVQPLPPSLHDLLAKEPELLQDIVALACANNNDGVSDIPRTLRIIAIRCMTAMSSDRHRVASILSATGVNVHHGALPSLLRTEISAMLSSADSSGSPAADRIRPDSGGLERSLSSQSGSSLSDKLSRSSGSLTISFECSRVSLPVQRIHMTESLLALVHSLAAAAGSSGATPLANSGVLGILIPLLTDSDVRHSRVVAQAIRAMQAIVEGSAQSLGCQLFRDHDGLTLVAKRIAAEVGVSTTEQSAAEQSNADEAADAEALKKRGESRELYERLGRRQMTPLEALEYPPPSSGATSRGLLPHSKWALLRALHQLLLRALGNGGSEVRELVVKPDLPVALRKIMAQPFLHGGSLFHSAATITTEIAHAEPTATPELVKAGIAATVLKTINLGLPPCSEAVRCIPNLLAALCLAPSARDIIVSSKPLKPYLLRLATPFYTRALHGESPVIIGSALDELMRHVEALRPDGSEAMIEYLRLSAQFVEVETRGCRRSPRSGSNGTNSTKTDTAPTVASDGSTEKSTQGASHANASKGDGEKTSSDAVLLDKMKLAVANNSCRLAGFAQGSSEHQEGIVQKGGLDHMIQLRLSPALAAGEASIREGHSYARHYPTPAMTIASLVSALRSFSSRHAGAVLKSLFAVILKDAATILKIAKDLDNAWLPEEDKANVVSKDLGRRVLAIGQKAMKENENRGLAFLVNSDEKMVKNDCEQNTGSEHEPARNALRRNMSDALKRLRVGVVLLSGLSRGGPGTPVWETARGSQVAAVVSTVERAARYHLAKVYTGLTLSASSDGDLSTARVTAAADPEMKSLKPDGASRALGDVDKMFGWSVTTDQQFVEACKKYKVPPEGHQAMRQEVKGLAWCLVTFAVAAQRLYSNLAKGLTFSSRRLSRDPARYAASARSLAATIGRIFALHLMAAEDLWDVKVVTMGDKHVVAAWDYVRGILIEINGTLFDDSRRGTQPLILRSFLDAGGAEALLKATRPLLIVQAAGSVPMPIENLFPTIRVDKRAEEELDKLLRSKSLSVSSYVLALSELSEKMQMKRDLPARQGMDLSKGADSEKEDTIMSSDSVSNQARGISRIVVSEPDSAQGHITGLSNEERLVGQDLLDVLKDEKKVTALKENTTRLKDIAFTHCKNVAVRRVASDVWNTLCGFLHLLGSCPGLLGANASPIPESTGSSNEWEPRDIQRSSLTVTLEMLTSVTNSPVDLLSSFRPDGSAMADLLGIIHTTSQVAEELSQKTNVDESGSNAQPDSEGFIETGGDTVTPRPRSPNPEMLRNLVEMGFSERRAAAALRRTAPGGIEYATEWLLTHPEEENDSDDSGGEREGREWDDGNETPTNANERPEAENGSENQNNGDDAGGQSSEANAGESGGLPEVARDDVMMDAADSEPSGVGNGLRSGSASQGNRDSANDGVERRTRTHKQRREKLKSSKEEKSKNGAVNVALDRDGARFLQISMETELSLLSAALEKSKVIEGEEIRGLVSAAASHVGPTLSKGFKGVKEAESASKKVNVTPISVDGFSTAKKRLFESLLNVTRLVIQESEKHSQGRHLPYLAIELLSILQKDGAMRTEGSSEFAILLDAGLRQALGEQKRNEAEVTSGLTGQTAAIWSHYGGNSARRALQSCGTYDLAYRCVSEGTVKWRSISGARRSSSNDVFTSLSADSKIKLRSVTAEEAQLLKRLTTCLLLLDSFVRYERKDSIIERTKESGKSKEDDSGLGEKKSTEEKQVEKMETDDGSDRDGSDGPSRNGDGATTITLETTRKALSEVMRDILGTASSAMEIDAKSAEEEEVDLEAVRQAAATGKAKMIESVKKSIAGWMTDDGEDVIKPAAPKVELLNHCLSLLLSWRDVEVGDALLACLQLIASLTAEWTLAKSAIENEAIGALLSLPQLEPGRSCSTDFKMVRLLIKTILRHMLEDPDTLQEAMVSEFRSLFSTSQSRARPGYSLRSLVMATSPMAARNMQCYVSALTSTVRAPEGERRGDLQLIDKPGRESHEVEDVLENRSNVRGVITSLALLMSEKFEKTFGKGVSNPQLSTHGTKKDEVLGLCRYALDLISEFVEFSQVAAVAYIKTASPSPEVPGSALDFVIQKILTLPVVDADKSSDVRVSREREELSTAARSLFLALCSKTASTHREAVASLARAVKLEADRPQVRAEVIAGLAQCIVPGTKLRVLRVVLDSGIANDLARSLRSLDLGVEKNFDVAMFVLRALSLIGQAATHMARHGDDAADDLTFGSTNRDPWSALRDRDDGIGPPGSSYIPVL